MTYLASIDFEDWGRVLRFPFLYHCFTWRPVGAEPQPSRSQVLAAFSSSSRMVPHLWHHSCRWVLSRVLYPHIVHLLDVFLAGTYITFNPSHCALYSIFRA